MKDYNKIYKNCLYEKCEWEDIGQEKEKCLWCGRERTKKVKSVQSESAISSGWQEKNEECPECGGTGRVPDCITNNGYFHCSCTNRHN